MKRHYNRIFIGSIIIMMTIAGSLIHAEDHAPVEHPTTNVFDIEGILNEQPTRDETEKEANALDFSENSDDSVETELDVSEARVDTRAYGTLGNVPYTYDTFYQTVVFDGRGVSNPTFPNIDKSLYQILNGTGTPADNYKMKRVEFRGRISTNYYFTEFFTSTEAELIGLENLDVSKTAYFDNLFYSYSGPTVLDGVGTWNMSSALSTSAMFGHSGRPGMTLHLPWGNTTWNLKSTFVMFRDTHYSAITGLETWNVSSLENAQAMFVNAHNITELNLTWGSNTRKINSIMYMFYLATNLETIIGTETWNLSGLGASTGEATDFLALTKVTEFSVPYTFGVNPRVGFFESAFRGATYLERIIVPEGNNADFFYKSELPAAKTSNGYRGYWAKQGDNKSQWTSNQLMSGYASYQPKAGIYYQVKENSNVNFYLQPNEHESTFVLLQSETVRTGTILVNYPDMSSYDDVFYGWYRDVELTQPYDITQEVRFDINLYGGISDTSARVPVNPYDVNDTQKIGNTTASSQQGMLQIVSVPEPLVFGNQKIGQGNQQFRSQTIEPSVQVFNHPRREAGWDLSVSMGKFSQGTPGQDDYHEVDGALTFQNTYTSSKDTQTTSVETVHETVTLYSDNQPTRIARANKKSGKGHWIFSWFGRASDTNEKVTLELDTHTLKPGTYESNVEWVLSSVPE
ncbi:WxL domain-containing protein [Erysipelothrix aquatica]|uniref:WxL domain-containing protein n=1 Tax=Erysipelothrix aquatica TaxID=2683714 RepID=UPI00135C87F1|nr:WxL domain-containing protein [Erysipelothrix aquatica]